MLLAQHPTDWRWVWGLPGGLLLGALSLWLVPYYSGKVADQNSEEPMNDAEDTERQLRLELMRLDRKLKHLDIRLRDQQLAHWPLKFLLLAGSFAIIVVLALSFICGPPAG